jgi:hypothetical protein
MAVRSALFLMGIANDNICHKNTKSQNFTNLMCLGARRTLKEFFGVIWCLSDLVAKEINGKKSTSPSLPRRG